MERTPAELAELKQAADRAYYVEAEPLMSDAEYDELKRRVGDMAVGDDRSPNFAKKAHRRPMLSLANVFSANEITSFFSQICLNQSLDAITVVIEPKIDGVSLELEYLDGVLHRAVTRGDGKVGDDVTENAKLIRGVPHVLQGALAGRSVEVRGEVYIPKAYFIKLNEALVADGDEPLSNPRNAAAGGLKQTSREAVVARGLHYLAYGLVANDGKKLHPDYHGLLSDLEDGDFTTADRATLRISATASAEDISEVDEVLKRFASQRSSLRFEIDGLVAKVNSISVREELGNSSHAPKWAVAYKFPPEEAVTILEDITYQVGRSGAITPVAELRPVRLGGATISRASLCNADEMARLGIRIGDQVVVVRAADVIPKVLRSNTPRTEDECTPFITVCPSCGGRLRRLRTNESEPERESAAYYCVDANCKDRVVQCLKHAASKSSLDIDGCGDAMIEALYNAGVLDIGDIFTVDVKTLGLGAAAAARFARAREEAKKQPLWRKIHALGAFGVGTTASKDLANKYGSVAAIASADLKDVEALIGKSRAFAIIHHLYNLAAEGVIEKLEGAGVTLSETRSEGALTGKSFVITGALMSGGRDDVAAKIEAAGGVVKNSVSKTIDYLVVGENAGGTKLKGAEKHGTRQITEEDLYNLLGVPMDIADEVDINNL